jgi:hypothetical protein
VAGAACANPGSPELIFDPPSFDIRESDVVAASNLIRYNVRLSVPPEEGTRVQVGIAKSDKEGSPDCVAYEDGLQVVESELVFSPSNFDEPQTVTITLNRRKANSRHEPLYQGTARAYFTHEISSADPNWASTTKRSMSVTVEDDSPCTAGAQRVDDPDNRIRKCGCLQEHFIEATDPLFCGSVTACTACSEGMICDENQIKEEAFLWPNMYRTDSSSLNVVPCPVKGVCAGNATAGNSLCRLGHEGPLCMVCSSEYVWDGIECVTCTQGKTVMLTVVGGLMCVGLLAVAYFIWPANECGD